jgi:hypothetical protein
VLDIVTVVDTSLPWKYKLSLAFRVKRRESQREKGLGAVEIAKWSIANLRDDDMGLRLRLPWGLKLHRVVDLSLSSKLRSQQIQFLRVDEHIWYGSYLLLVKVDVFDRIFNVDGSFFDVMDGELVHKVAMLWERL